MHNLVLFFAVGVFQDLLVTYYYQVITTDRAKTAAFMAGLLTVVNLLVLYAILARLEDEAVSSILAYALGNSVGTYLVVKRHVFKAYFKK
ncbi:MAG: hypothetical protein V4674_04325 [Patescibacteria group bacterium]